MRLAVIIATHLKNDTGLSSVFLHREAEDAVGLVPLGDDNEARRKIHR